VENGKPNRKEGAHGGTRGSPVFKGLEAAQLDRSQVHARGRLLIWTDVPDKTFAGS